MAGYAWVFWLGWTLALGGGAMLVAWIVGRGTRGVRRCPACDYDMSGTTGLTCPECGRGATGERAMLRRRRRRRWLVGAVVVLPLGVGMLVFNPGRELGWASSLPRWAIWPVMPWFDGWTDGAVARMTGAMWGPAPRRGARWDQLLLAQRCSALADKAERLCRQTLEERMAADAQAPKPPPAAPPVIGPNTPVTAIAMMYQAPDPLMRAKNEIAGILPQTGDEAGLAAPAIGRVMRTAMEQGDTETWWWSMRTLSQAKHVDPPTEKRLQLLAQDPSVSIRIAALGTLVDCRHSLRNDDLVRRLVAALDDPHVDMRKFATGRLGNMGADARAAVERLTATARNDPDSWVRASASAAIVMIEEAR